MQHLDIHDDEMNVNANQNALLIMVSTLVTLVNENNSLVCDFTTSFRLRGSLISLISLCPYNL